MSQSIKSGDYCNNTEIETINNYYDNKKFSYDLSKESSKRKFFQNCVYEIIQNEKIEIISIQQLKSKLAFKLLENCANSDDNRLIQDILPDFNKFLNSEIFEKEEGYKLSTI